MKSIQFQGHHSCIPHADTTLLPDSAHTLWQAWRMPSGDYIIQALTEDKRPEGEVHHLKGSVFPQILTPLLATVSPDTNANSPTLIHTWYNEISSLKGPALYGPPLVEYEHFTMPPLHPETLAALQLAHSPDGQNGQDDPGKTTLLLQASCPPSIHDTEQPSLKQFTENSQGESGGANTAAGTVESIPLKKAFIPSANTNGGPTIAELTNALASGEFAPQQIDVFFQRLQQDADHMLEEHVARLIAIPAKADNTPYQAVLTELGLVLRQKKQYTLAKQCHLRALQLAPNDERILFNIARTEYESGNITDAQEYLERCLSVAPDFTVAKNFLNFISTDS